MPELYPNLDEDLELAINHLLENHWTGPRLLTIPEVELRERVRDYLQAAGSVDTINVRLSRWIREKTLSDQALDLGYTIESTLDLLDWMGRELKYDFMAPYVRVALPYHNPLPK